MAINYDDERFDDVESAKNDALSENNNTYDSMINQSDEYFQNQINAVKDYANTQKQNQQEQTDFAIDKIEQQKEWAKKDYTKEQSGAYTDWQKQSNQYGVNAEQKAASGMTNTGYTESSQVSMYNQYQNRVTAARKSYSRAVQNYDNAMTEARLQNNSVLAEIAYNALQQQLSLSLQGFQYKNTLVLDKAKTRREIDSEYYQRYRDVVSQINTENAQAMQKDQFDRQMAFDREKFAWQKRQAELAAGGGSSGGGGSSLIKKFASDIGATIAKNAGVKLMPNKSEEQVTVDQKSVLDLGYGPISASKLNSLIDAGIVKEYQEGGKIKFEKVVQL